MWLGCISALITPAVQMSLLVSCTTTKTPSYQSHIPCHAASFPCRNCLNSSTRSSCHLHHQIHFQQPGLTSCVSRACLQTLETSASSSARLFVFVTGDLPQRDKKTEQQSVLSETFCFPAFCIIIFKVQNFHLIKKDSYKHFNFI